ncbi:glucarate dehydratase (plasmid) [Novosphingobium sp. ES2-1]|nr:glucarate dehydratase [Novosphingobium sp. ES2-1]
MAQGAMGDPGRRVRIVDIKVTPIAFRDPPLRNAAGVHEPYALRSIIEITASNGQTGLGEGYGDAASLMALEAVAPRLIGLEITDLNGLRNSIGETLAGLPPPPPGQELAPGSDPARQGASCLSAIEVPLLDLQAKTAGLPLHALLGGAVRREVPFSAYLFFKFDRHIDTPDRPDSWGEAATPDQIVAQARRMITRHGFRGIKLKGGTLPPTIEVASIEALAEAFPGYPLRIDPNGAWSMETAISVAARLGHLIECYEDPVDGLDAMAELHRQTGLPLATNMVVTCFDHVRQSVAKHAVQIVLSDHHYWVAWGQASISPRSAQPSGLAFPCIRTCTWASA